MSNTSIQTVPVTVYYNDALTDPQSITERALADDNGRPYRMSEINSDTRVQILVDGGAASLPAARIADAYQQGDPLLKVHETLVPALSKFDDDPAAWTAAVCETVFRVLNVDHPYGWSRRSMSVGDVVVVGESAFAVAREGFVSVSVDADQIKDGIR